MLDKHEDDMSPLNNEQYSRLRNRVQVIEEKIGQLAEELAELVADMYSVYVRDKPLDLDVSKDDTVSCGVQPTRAGFRPFESLYDLTQHAPSFTVQYSKHSKILRRGDSKQEYEITSVFPGGVNIAGQVVSYQQLLENWVFTDGTPCGVPTL